MNDMPRVLLTGFCAVPGPRRAGVQLRHVIRALTPFHSVDVLVVREGEQAYVERQGAVRVLRVPTHDHDLRGQIHAFQRALKRQLDGADYDIVHCRDSWSGIPVLEARSRYDYAVVYDLTRSPLGETTFDSDLDAQYGRDEEACILASDLVLAPTAAAVKALQGRGKPERVVLSPPGVDVDRFDWEDARHSGPPRILYAGTIDPGRGIRVLIRAMAAILREVDARLIIAGPVIAPNLDTALRGALRELGLHDKVELLGPVDHEQLPSLIASATVCVVPAAPDLSPNPAVVFPTKMLEYMACKRAMVAPRREVVQMVVENAREALLFEPGDAMDLARKLIRLLGEPALREKLAAAAYERVRRDFTASASRRGLRDAYSLLATRFATHLAESEDPQIEILADDDDFEATVFDEGPETPAVDTALNRIDDSQAAIDSLSTGNTSSEIIAAPPAPDETIERSPVAPPPATPTSDAWARPGTDDWVVTNVAAAPRSVDEESGVTVATPDDGTPIEGVSPPPAIVMSSENAFVAGEIDVPTPRPDRRAARVELPTEAAAIGASDAEPDTDTRTPPQRRRS
jgi:glycosyltransferase involved in cell wall biosynthesis